MNDITFTDSAIAAALALAQSEMQNAPLNKVNPHFKSKYADLAAIREATLPSLTKHGLSLCQLTHLDERGFFLITRLTHKSGQTIESEYPVPLAVDRPQVMGSALTYARRYSWAAICGIASEEDDDANAAQEGAKNGVRKSSAAAKRDGDWDKFQHDLSDVQSAVGLERLRTDYRKNVFPSWNKDWQNSFEEECEKKLATFSQGETLAETLTDSQWLEQMQKATTKDQLLKIGADIEAALPEEAVDRLLPAFRDRMKAIKAVHA